jgi:hypothetical protein
MVVRVSSSLGPFSIQIAELSMPVVTDGPIFSLFRNGQQNYTRDTEACSAETVERLFEGRTASEHPGMMLGQVQSGKTRAFMGAIAIAFDNDVDVAIIFTKGTRALTKQTLARVRRDLKPAIDRELVTAHDIKVLPNNLTPWDLERKLILVCKKEDDNLRRLRTALTDTYPDLAGKRLLIVDDEADFASVGYRRRGGVVDSNVIPAQIDDIRQVLANVLFLQVTATPYSLYLQPAEVQIPATQVVFLPIRPAFTVLVPVHAGYIGGDFYFEESRRDGSTASFLPVTVSDTELVNLRRPNSFDLQQTDLVTSPAIAALRRAIVTFVVGAWIRRQQQRNRHETPEHYSFIVHTHTTRAAHTWQASIVRTLVRQLQEAAVDNPGAVQALVWSAYEDLVASLMAEGINDLPALGDLQADIPEALRAVMVTTVNSERDIEELLDENGELYRRNPFNIFIGGQILDRGVTIERLIGFFYGRNPQRSQQDTVLQHSRMYGNRARADLAVTRFYTSAGIYQVMRTIYEIDTALREAIAAHGPDHGVVFLETDPRGRVVPCSPNKILVSNVTTLRQNSTSLPIGFTTSGNAADIVRVVDGLLTLYAADQGQIIPVPEILELIDQIGRAIAPDPGYDWDIDAFKGAISHLAENAQPDERGEVFTLVRNSRNAAKRRGNGRLQDYPAGSADEAILAQGGSRPRLLLNREAGTEQQGWGGVPFWWPMLFVPPNTRPVIFANRR